MFDKYALLCPIFSPKAKMFSIKRCKFFCDAPLNDNLRFIWRFWICSQGLVSGLQEINKLKNQVQDIYVPFEVFDYIDQDKNPQLYTKDCVEKALAKNEEVKGKIDAYRKFKSNMLAELFKTFPNEMNMYRAYRPDSV